MAVTPPTASIQVGKTQQFTATVTNTTNKAVTWSLSGAAPCPGTGCGTLNTTPGTPGPNPVTYTAPANVPSPATVTLTATLVADPTQTASATITITAGAPPIMVTVAPSTVSVLEGKMEQFTATVTNDPTNMGVTWSLSGPAPCPGTGCGTLNTTAGTPGPNPVTYTAPATVASPIAVTVTATSVASTSTPNKVSASATVAVLPAITVTVSPTSATVVVNGTQTFTATLTNDTTNAGVNWSLTQGGVACSPACGSVAPASTKSGVATAYTALASVPANPTVTLTAASVAQPTHMASATITITGAAAISVTVSPTSATVAVTKTQQFTATVTNTTNTDVNWTLTQGGMACPTPPAATTCGTLNTMPGTPGPNPVTYTAPASVPSPATVTITATSVADMTKSGSATVTVTGALSGQFAFLLQGLDNGTPVAIAGSFTAQANGTVMTGGVEDVNRFTGSFTVSTNLTITSGSYTLGPDNRGTLTLVAGLATAQVTTTFAFALNSSGTLADLILTQFSDSTGPIPGIHGSGFFQAQDSTAFNASAITGNYALGFVGALFDGARAGMLAPITAVNCNLNTNGNTLTVNVNGIISTNQSFTGSCGNIQTTGRGTATFTFSFNFFGTPTHNFAFYIIGSDSLIFIGTESAGTVPLLSGKVLKQVNHPSGFNNADLACAACVFGTSGFMLNTGVLTASKTTLTLGRAVKQTNGTLTITLDQNNGGTITTNTTTAGFTFQVQPAGNGKITPPTIGLTVGAIDFVLIDTDKALLLGEGTDKGFPLGKENDIAFGDLMRQTALNFNLPPALPGTFIAGTRAPTNAGVPSISVPNISGVVTPSAPTSGSLIPPSTVDAAVGSIVTTGVTVTGMYSLDIGTGRGTGTTTLPGAASFVFYIIQRDRFVLIGVDSGINSDVIMDFRM